MNNKWAAFILYITPKSRTVITLTDNRWKLKQTFKAKRQGQVWIVEDASGGIGYFKFATKKQWYFAGPMIANEYIAAALAGTLGFPVAELKYAAVEGPDGKQQEGIVSVAADAKEVLTWREADRAVRKAPEKHVKHADLLRGLVVFDAWIANIDRSSGKNLVLHRNSGEEKYDWYLIDHGHSLYGSPRKWVRGSWKSPIWQKIWKYYYTPKGLLRLQSSWKALLPMIRRIEKLEASDIDKALDQVPSGHLHRRERRFIRRLLLTRKKQLRPMLKRWLSYRGVKESRK
jgi:hypothetical protein